MPPNPSTPSLQGEDRKRLEAWLDEREATIDAVAINPDCARTAVALIEDLRTEFVSTLGAMQVGANPTLQGEPRRKWLERIAYGLETGYFRDDHPAVIAFAASAANLLRDLAEHGCSGEGEQLAECEDALRACDEGEETTVAKQMNYLRLVAGEHYNGGYDELQQQVLDAINQVEAALRLTPALFGEESVNEAVKRAAEDSPVEVDEAVVRHVVRSTFAHLEDQLATQPDHCTEEKPERCPTCKSRNPWFTKCMDAADAEADGHDVPRSPRTCTDPWHQQPAGEKPECEQLREVVARVREQARDHASVGEGLNSEWVEEQFAKLDGEKPVESGEGSLTLEDVEVVGALYDKDWELIEVDVETPEESVMLVPEHWRIEARELRQKLARATQPVETQEGVYELLAHFRDERVRLTRALQQLQMGPDTLTQDGLKIVLAALYPEATSPEEAESAEADHG